MGTRPLTDEEQAMLQANGIDPEQYRVHYRSEAALHLKNEATGAEITIYLGGRNNG